MHCRPLAMGMQCTPCLALDCYYRASISLWASTDLGVASIMYLIAPAQKPTPKHHTRDVCLSENQHNNLITILQHTLSPSHHPLASHITLPPRAVELLPSLSVGSVTQRPLGPVSRVRSRLQSFTSYNCITSVACTYLSPTRVHADTFEASKVIPPL
jgi:hypothetical protein